MRFMAFCLLLLLPQPALAQQRDSFFRNYETYAAFVDSRIMGREFVELIQVLGGRDEYTKEELAGIKQRFFASYPSDFTDSAVTKITDLGNGFRQEMRVYWGGSVSYIFFYAMLHERDGETVVLNFSLNTSVSKILGKF
ncbi:MAG: hypothetical protein GXP03_12860 [Alphaproteobacteria bacterium]|nr:hypothetical protein [Alphaproteobacteria bacterium]